MAPKKIPPIHPGEILLEEFLTPMGISQNRLALDIGVPARRINEIVLGKRRVTADTALRLGKYFGMSPQFWLGLQMDYDLDIAEDKLEKRLNKEVHIYKDAIYSSIQNICNIYVEKSFMNVYAVYHGASQVFNIRHSCKGNKSRAHGPTENGCGHGISGGLFNTLSMVSTI